MNIVFDAEDFKNKPRGIVKSTICLYRACKEKMPELRFIGLARKPVKTPLPEFMEIVKMRPDMNRSIWRILMHNAYLATHDCSAIHYPANGMIPKLFFTKNVILTMYDVIQLTIPNYFADPAKEQRFRKKRQDDLNKAALLFTSSEYSKKEILKHFKTTLEPVVLYCAPILDPGMYAPPAGLRRQEDYFLINATYDPRKGLPTLLEVFYGLWKTKQITSRLYIAGEQYYHSSEFKELMNEAVAAGAVKEFGYVSDGEMVGLIKHAKGLIYPSKYEGFGLPPVDAMNLGCAVITTRGTSLPEVCGDAVLYVDPDERKTFGDAILALDRNEHLRKELVEKGKIQVQRYSWNKSAGIFLEHISKLSKRDDRGKTD